jgi:hypothetical protein
MEVYPQQNVPVPKDRYQYFYVDVGVAKGANKFISHKAGACKGTIVIDLPEHMEVTPKEQLFELAATDQKRFYFKVVNREWSDEVCLFRPLIRFEGKDTIFETVYPGTRILRSKKAGYIEPLDNTGLLVYGGYNDKKKNGRFDKCTGPSGPHYYPGHGPSWSNEGVKGWCVNSGNPCHIYRVYKNIDYWQGTMCFWMRKDPGKRNENLYKSDPASTMNKMVGYNNGESIVTVGFGYGRSISNTGMNLKRFRSWKGKPGYLQYNIRLMNGRTISAQYQPFNWEHKWRHIGLVWSVPEKRLELYVDGKVASKGDPGEGDWHATPWHRGRVTGHGLIIITTDHGSWCATCRDEVYIYNRCLSAEEIMANRKLAEQ